MILLLVVIVSIIIAVLFSLFVKKDANNTLLLAIILAPAFFYWLSDRIPVELGMGQLYAKFETALRMSTQTVLEETVASSALLSLPDQDSQITEGFETAPPEGTCLDYLLIKLNLVPQYPNPQYNRYIVYATHSIRNAIACGKLVGVVVLREDGKYVGSYDSSFLTEDEFAELAVLIQSNTIFGTALGYPEKRIREGEGYFAFVRTTDTLREAWKQFQSTRGAFLAVTDQELRFKGILTRNSIQNRLLGELARSRD